MRRMLWGAAAVVALSTGVSPAPAGGQQVGARDFEPNVERPAFPEGTGPRVLVDEGHHPKSILRLMRGSVRVFQDRTLAWWASKTIEEGDRSARFREYRDLGATEWGSGPKECDLGISGAQGAPGGDDAQYAPSPIPRYPGR